MKDVKHAVDIVTCDSEITGRTYKPVCVCGYRSHFQQLVRAEDMKREHLTRHIGDAA